MTSVISLILIRQNFFTNAFTIAQISSHIGLTKFRSDKMISKTKTISFKNYDFQSTQQQFF